jgi:hypothetical protein
MAHKLNCWEFNNCEFASDGEKTDSFTCPAASESSADGVNGGRNGGRICWAIAGTFCNDKIHGLFAKEKNSCLSCEFFKLVAEEENVINYEILMPVQLNQFLQNRSNTKNV